MSADAPVIFTPRAEQVLKLARLEAIQYNHDFIGTEHLLLGLLKLGQGCAIMVLQKLGLDLDTVRLAVIQAAGIGPDHSSPVEIPFTPQVEQVLVFASEEARALNHTYVGTEHLLLGLLREGEGVAARVLKNLEIDVDEARREILQELAPRPAI